MYETEANQRIEPLEQLPHDAVAAFGALHDRVVARTVLPWSEHCTECVWPTCYTSCDLYSPREDGRCRRFVDGMVRVESPTAFNQYLLKIRFKQWGKLWTPGNLHLRSPRSAGSMERMDHRIGTALYHLPLPRPIRNVVISKRYSLKKRLVSRRDGRTSASAPLDRLPTSFLLECFNPNHQSVDLSLTIRSARAERIVPFQKLIKLDPGYQSVRIPLSEIATMLDLHSPFNIELIPNVSNGETTLYFGLMEFVQEAKPAAEKIPKVKCVVWDLDHTMWDGVLVEDGADRLELKPGMINILQDLDRRGILQSIASKNNDEEAMSVLRRLHVDELFLYPQISWMPKGESLKTIARRLNIGLDSILFIDDQEFERKQVEASCPGVRTLDATQYQAVLAMKECDVPITAESASRRKMYKVEQERQQIQESFKDDYKAFLKDCDIRLKISPLTEENLARVHELTQRTNQMNFSGTRYDRDKLKQVLSDPRLDTYVLTCEDRFGSYGIVGFGLVDSSEPRMTDLMFSCRIQAKRVEHAFLRTIIQTYVGPNGRDFYANYRKTSRNAPSGQVFADLALQEVSMTDGVTSLLFPRDGELLDDGIIKVENLNHCLIEGA